MLCPENNSKDFDREQCKNCQWYFKCLNLESDNNIFGKATGDNYPTIPCNEDCKAKNNCEGCKWNNQDSKINLYIQEVKNLMNLLGQAEVWKAIELIGNCKLRLRYRLIFLKLGGKSPERKE